MCVCSCAAGNPWLYTQTSPRCRIQIGSDSNTLDLDRLHAVHLTECIRACHNDTSCQAVTFKYGQSNTTDNCWLKIATAVTKRTNDSASKVSWVSVHKPSPYAVDFKKRNQTCTDVEAELRRCEYQGAAACRPQLLETCIWYCIIDGHVDMKVFASRRQQALL
jgi:hypothetical protein